MKPGNRMDLQAYNELTQLLISHKGLKEMRVRHRKLIKENMKEKK